jgi:hypothetical protein
MWTAISVALVVFHCALAAPPVAAVKPTALLDNAVFVGDYNNTISYFLGIPYGQTTCGLSSLQPIETDSP